MMPRNSGGANGFLDENCKIRKRVCSSPSPTHPVLKTYRFKRAILAPKKREGSSTPVPTWMMNARSPSSAASFSLKSHYKHSKGGHKGSETPISARKLANALWELNRFPSPKTMEELHERRSKKEMIRTSGKLSHLSDPSHSPASEFTYRSRSSAKRKTLPLIYPSSHLGKTSCVPPDMMSIASLMEMEAHPESIAARSSTKGNNGHFKELKNNLTTLKELLKLLNRLLEPGQQHPSTVALASVLNAQLDQVCVQINHLIKEQQSKQNEISYLRKYLAMEKDSWRTKEQERMTTNSHSIIKELATEKKLRRRAERMNKELGIELSQIKASLVKAAGELEKERKKREVIEHVCTEMGREIGHDKANAEEFKKQSLKVREELEKEREMLHLANELREERVHMKLSEAKFQFEEKNAAVDKLRNELDAFFTAKKTEMVYKEQDQLHATRTFRCNNLVVDREESQEGQERDYGTDSEDGELHTIELNMDSNENGYNWSQGVVTFEIEDELVPTKSSDANSIFSGMQKHTYSLDESIIGVKDEFVENSQCLSSELVEGKLADDKDQRLDQDVKRDQKSIGCKIVLPRTIPSPIRRWSKQQSLHHSSSQFSEGSKVNEMLKAIRDSGSKAKLVRNRNEVQSHLEFPSNH